MRGDSIRDLYAKTLALLGLGLLAGVGALVDYWPVGVLSPQVAAGTLPAPVAFAAAPAVDVAIPVVPARPAAATVADSAVPVATLALTDAPLPAVGRPLELSGPTLPALDLEPARIVAAPVADLALAAPSLPPGPDFDPAVVYQLGGSPDESGLLSNAVDMMKSTGSTIARGGAATGASIVGAFRVVSGAFKKLKFF